MKALIFLLFITGWSYAQDTSSTTTYYRDLGKLHSSQVFDLKKPVDPASTYKRQANGVFFVSLLNPLAGSIYCVVAAKKPLRPEQVVLPNAMYRDNAPYIAGVTDYTSQQRKKKIITNTCLGILTHIIITGTVVVLVK